MHTILLSGGDLGGLTWTLTDEPTIGLEFTIESQGYRVFDAVTKTIGDTTITTWYATWTGVVA